MVIIIKLPKIYVVNILNSSRIVRSAQWKMDCKITKYSTKPNVLECSWEDGFTAEEFELTGRNINGTSIIVISSWNAF